MDAKIENWMRKRLLDKSHPCTEFRLEHIGGDKESSTICTKFVDLEKEIESQLQEVVSEFRVSAEDHSREFPRTQAYCVEAYSDNSRLIGQARFRMKAPNDMVDASETEPPGPAGSLALAMRLTESLTRTLLTQIAANTVQMSETNVRLQARISELEIARQTDFEMRERLLSRQAERDIMMLEAERGQDRKDRLVKRAEQVLGPILPEILKKMKLVPDKLGMDQKVQSFLASLSDDQQNKIIQILEPQQFAQLAEILPQEEVSSTGKDGK
jgi:hypothetical protein